MSQTKARPKISAPILQSTSNTAPSMTLHRLPSYNAAVNEVPAKKGKSDAAIDVIDNLDMTGSLFNAGTHHAGPFDAASAHRNRPNAKVPQPMAAFDGQARRSKSTNERSNGGSRPSQGVSARAQAALAAMSAEEHAFETLNGSMPAGLAGFDSQASIRSTDNLLAPPSRSRRLSDGSNSVKSVHLGFPTPYNLVNSENSSTTKLGRSATTSRAVRRADDDTFVSDAQKIKAAKVAEAFGLQDSEAWEDYGRSAFAKKAPRESTYDLTNAQKRSPATLVPKGLRAERAASVWDMEATLREGVPVALAPPMPPLPSAYSGQRSGLSKSVAPSSAEVETSPQAGVKRSKSLMQRLKKARQNPMAPMLDDSTADALPTRPSASRTVSNNLGMDSLQTTPRRVSPSFNATNNETETSAFQASEPSRFTAEVSSPEQSSASNPHKHSPTRTSSLKYNSPVTRLRKDDSFNDRDSVTLDVLEDFHEEDEGEKIAFGEESEDTPAQQLSRKRSLLDRLRNIG